MTTEQLELRDLTHDDLDAAFAVRTRSFGKLDGSLRGWWNRDQEELIASRRILGVFAGEQLVATAKARPYEQFWGGRTVAMSGVAGVVVAPEWRGRGVATLLMAGLAERGVELGDAVSALYPATVTPYRRGGWEVVGAQSRIAIDTSHLRGLGSPRVRLRPGGTGDVDRLRGLLARHYGDSGASGPKLLTADELEQALTDEEAFSYVADDGFVLYEWQEGDLAVTCLVAQSETTARALWGVVGSGASVAKKVHAYVGPDDPVHLLLAEEAAHEVHQTRWMLRVLDLRGAVAARGYPRSVSGAAGVTVTDPMLDANSGAWLLEVDRGDGTLTPTSHDGEALRVGPNGLAALYAGTPVRTLRTAGLASGGSADGDRFLDAALGGTPAYLLEYF
jgi:predicted acetyltransferase